LSHFSVKYTLLSLVSVSIRNVEPIWSERDSLRSASAEAHEFVLSISVLITKKSGYEAPDEKEEKERNKFWLQEKGKR